MCVLSYRLLKALNWRNQTITHHQLQIPLADPVEPSGRGHTWSNTKCLVKCLCDGLMPWSEKSLLRHGCDDMGPTNLSGVLWFRRKVGCNLSRGRGWSYYMVALGHSQTLQQIVILLCQVSSKIYGRLERAGAIMQPPDAECRTHKLQRSVLDFMHLDPEKWGRRFLCSFGHCS